MPQLPAALPEASGPLEIGLVGDGLLGYKFPSMDLQTPRSGNKRALQQSGKVWLKMNTNDCLHSGRQVRQQLVLGGAPGPVLGLAHTAHTAPRAPRAPYPECPQLAESPL